MCEIMTSKIVGGDGIRTRDLKTVIHIHSTQFTKEDLVFLRMTKVSTLVEWLEYPTTVREGPGSKPKKLLSIYLMDVVG